MDTTQRIFRVPLQNLERLNAEIADLNKRATKLGLQPIKLIEAGVEFETHKNARTKVEYQKEFRLFTFEGSTPKLAGWSLVAVVEDMGGENLIREVPGQTCPIEYRKSTLDCDHCQCNRRRKEVFVLHNEDGRYVQVGRQCIKDFLGGASPEGILAGAEIIFCAMDEIGKSEGEGYGGGGRTAIGLEEYLATVAICIRKMGWVSSSQAREEGREGATTAFLAWRICTDHTGRYIKELVAEMDLNVEDKDVELAKATIEWARSQPVDGEGYLYNLGVACRLGGVTSKHSGLVGSAIAAYQRHLEQEINRKQRESTYVNEFVGEPKQRLGFAAVEVVSMKSIPGNYGVRTLVRMKDDGGRTLIWWGTGDIEWMETGKKYDITGTIKKHDTYKPKDFEFKQTVITRVVEGLPKPKKGKKAA